MEAFEGALIKLMEQYQGHASLHEIVRALEIQAAEKRKERDEPLKEKLLADTYDPDDPYGLGATSG